MGIPKIQKKGLIDRPRDIDLINKLAVSPLDESEVYTFKVKLCDNDVDRVGDKMTDQFLNEVANSVVGVTGLLDHDWSANNQFTRMYAAEVVESPTELTKLGEPRKYVLGRAYTLNKYTDFIDKINSGLLKEASISFKSEGDTCSICGSPMEKSDSDIGCCKNGHVAGEVYDGHLCYNKLNHLKDVLEWSLVAVPCQSKAGISKSYGGKPMKRTELLIKQFMSSKTFKEAPKEEKEKLEEVVKTTEDKELSDDEIKGLIEENARLQEENKSLTQKIADLEKSASEEKLRAAVSKAVDDMGPITPKVKEMFMKDIPWDKLRMEEDGQIPGMADVFAGLTPAYKGLFADEKPAEGGTQTGGTMALEVENNTREKGCGTTEKSYTSPSKTKLGVGGNSVSKSVSNRPGFTWE